MSAAHCFEKDSITGKYNENRYQVVVGNSHRQMSAMSLEIVQILNVFHIEIPSSFNGRDDYYLGDIAILTLQEPIIYHDHIKPACLNLNAVTDEEKQLPSDNTFGLVAGFGYTENEEPADELKKIRLPILNIGHCKKTAADRYKPFLVEDKFCAGFTNGNGGVCNGDSGSCIVFKDPKTNKYYIYGIVSNSEQKCNPNYVALYTNVMYYIELISKQVKQSQANQ